MNTVDSPQMIDEIEALKASMNKLADDLSSTPLPSQSVEALRSKFTDLMLALHKIERHVNFHAYLHAVRAFTSAVRDVPTCPELAAIINEQLAQTLAANFVALLIQDVDTHENFVVHTLGDGPFTMGQRIAAGAGFIGQVIASGKPYWSAETSPLTDSLESTPAAIGMPLITQGQTIGLLWMSRDTEFSQGEMNLTWLLSDLAAIALHRTDTQKTLIESRSELLHVSAQLTELDTLKAKFINDMSHELRTPITGLNMVLYLLERNGQEKYAQYLSNMREEVERLTNFSESILDVTRLESKMSNAQFEPIDFNLLVTQLSSIYHTRAERTNVSWAFDGANTPLMVNGDQNLLLTAVGNILTNAVNYALGGKVTVRTRLDTPSQCAFLIVENNGIGVDTKELPHLFERFYRGNRVAETSIPGTGLGLAIVKEIVDFHQGRVEAEKTSEGKMRFTLCLPLQNPINL
jgi:signal transduction histidine kinase